MDGHLFVVPKEGFTKGYAKECRSQWPRGLSRRSAAARRDCGFESHREAWMSVCCECCVLPGRGLCDRRITRPEESYRLWCVVECDLETSWMRKPWPTGGCCTKKKRKYARILQMVPVNLGYLTGIAVTSVKGSITCMGSTVYSQ